MQDINRTVCFVFVFFTCSTESEDHRTRHYTTIINIVFRVFRLFTHEVHGWQDRCFSHENCEISDWWRSFHWKWFIVCILIQLTVLYLTLTSPEKWIHWDPGEHRLESLESLEYSYRMIRGRVETSSEISDESHFTGKTPLSIIEFVLKQLLSFSLALHRCSGVIILVFLFFLLFVVIVQKAPHCCIL